MESTPSNILEVKLADQIDCPNRQLVQNRQRGDYKFQIVSFHIINGTCYCKEVMSNSDASSFGNMVDRRYKGSREGGLALSA